MRILYLFIFLLSICGNELILNYVMMDKQGVSYFELSSEDSSEKEYEDLFEDDYFISDQSFHFQSKHLSALNPTEESLLRLNPYIEIHSPPPES